MRNHIVVIGLVGFSLIFGGEAQAQPKSAPAMEYIQPEGQPMGPPFSPAVKAGKLIFVSGIPAFDKNGKLAVGDFPAQMKQVMQNITDILKASGAGWDRVVKVNVLLARREDFKEMNSVYATYFPSGKYPARTTAIVSLPHPDFLLEIECVAVLE
jgi:2-iminobutanoate/2-iminopropanoate deaminase